MSAAIYYFSGTGNSLSVAKDIACAIDATLIPIASVINENTIKLEADIIGIVFPVYYGELPVIIKRFAEKLNDIENKYIFAVCTFGGSAGYSLKLLREIIDSRGGELAATYRVHMPQNSFAKPWENKEKLYSAWKKNCTRVINNTKNREKGEFLKNRFLIPLFILVDFIVHLMKPRIRKSFIKLSNAPADLETDELIYRNDTSFKVNERCNGCGLCVKVCPVNNIAMINNRPVWQHHCENCLACYNRCPNNAIEGGIAKKGYYYRHPDIKITEVIKN